MKKPIIGITMFRENKAAGTYNSLNLDYANSIIEAGGIPILLPITNPNLCEEYLNIIDGILFSGGEDIAPHLFHEEPILKLGSVDSIRDNFELTLFSKAFDRKIPILGICRGLQLINVALGGNLYQDIDTQVLNVNGHHPSNIARDELYHSVIIEKNSFLYKVFKSTKISVNSFHHQAIKNIGQNLIISAKSQDGIIEAIESSDIHSHFILAVQWHPENLKTKYLEFLNIFKVFIEASQK